MMTVSCVSLKQALLRFVQKTLPRGSWLLLTPLEVDIPSIGVRASDYEDSIEMIQKMLPDLCFLQTVQSESTFFLSGRIESRICVDGSEWALPGWQEEAIHQGYCLRIHPIFQWKRLIAGSFFGKKQVAKKQWALARTLFQDSKDSFRACFPAWAEVSGLDRKVSEPLTLPLDWKDWGYPMQEGSGPYALPVFDPERVSVNLPISEEHWVEAAEASFRLVETFCGECGSDAEGMEASIEPHADASVDESEATAVVYPIWKALEFVLHQPDPEWIDCPNSEEVFPR